MNGAPAHRHRKAGVCAPGYFIERFVVADGFDEVFPFQFVRVGLGLWERPDHVCPGLIVALEKTAFGGCMDKGGDHRRTPGADGIAREFIVTSGHVTRVNEQFRSVGESVFHRVVVEVLIDGIAAIEPPPLPLRPDRPRTFHPAAFIDVMCDVIMKHPAAGP